MSACRTLLVFEVGGQTCALPAEAAQEVVPMASLAHPVGLPDALEGFLNLRGRLLPVVRIDRLFGLPAATLELHTPLVVLRAGWVLLVGRVHQVAEISEGDLRPVAENHCFNDCAVAQVSVAGGVAHVLEPGRLLLAAECQRLAELQAAAELRREQWEPCPA